LSGGILLFSWFNPSGFYLIFIAFVPFLFVIENLTIVRSTAVRSALLILPFFIWNFKNLWIFKINATACILAIILNTLVISAPWIIFSRFQKRTRIALIKYSFLIISVLSMEIFHKTWQLSYPFHLLGNAFSVAPDTIQWYEYTGIYGGTVWILISNILVFSIFINFKSDHSKTIVLRILLFMLILIFPLIISKHIRNRFKPGESIPLEVVAIHPQIRIPDKYNMDNEKLLKHYLSVSSIYLTPNTDYLIWPETAFPDMVFIDSLETDKIVDSIITLYRNTDTKIITGFVLGEMGKPESGETEFTEYNAAVQIIPSQKRIDIKTKDKCVPFTERIPYPKILSFLSNYIEGLAGYRFSKSGNYGKVNFISDNIRVVPSICYESAFCDINLPLRFNENTFIAVILNEGWYNNLRVAGQFMHLAVLRAIEYRKPVVRSSNMGISCTVSSLGECSHILSRYGGKGFKAVIQANNYNSFFARHHRTCEQIIISFFFIFLLFFFVPDFRYFVNLY